MHDSPGYHTPGSHGTKFFIISPQGRTPPQVKLTGVAYPGKSVFQGYDTPGSHSSRPSGVNSHFLKLLQRPLKGQCHKNKCGSLFYTIKGLHFVLKQKLSGMKSFFDSPGYDIPGSQFFATQIQIT